MLKIGVKIPLWLRVLNILIGLFYVIISGALLYNISEEPVLLLNYLVFSLFLMGFAKIANGINFKIVSKTWMSLNVLIGSCIIIASTLILIFSDWATITAIIMITISLFIQGLYRGIHVLLNTKISKWALLLNIVVSFISIIICIYVFLRPDLALLTLIIILDLLFILNGFLRILSGIQGYLKKEKQI